MEFKNIPFYFRRKQFPRLSEHGVLDAIIPNEGLSIGIKVIIDKKSPINTLTVKAVHVVIDKFKLIFHETSNDSLLNPLSSLVASKLKKEIEKATREKVIEMIEAIDTPITNAKNRFMTPTVEKKTSLENIFRMGKSVKKDKDEREDVTPLRKSGIPVNAAWASDKFTL